MGNDNNKNIKRNKEDQPPPEKPKQIEETIQNKNGIREENSQKPQEQKRPKSPVKIGMVENPLQNTKSRKGNKEANHNRSLSQSYDIK